MVCIHTCVYIYIYTYIHTYIHAKRSSNSGGLLYTSSNIFTCSQLHIFTTSHLHIFSSSHLLMFSSYIFTSSHIIIFTSSHLLIFTSSHLHIFSSSHLLIFTSSHLHLLIFKPSHLSHLHIFSLLPYCPLLLLPSPLSFFSISLLRRGAVPTKRHEMQPFRTKWGSIVNNCGKIAVFQTSGATDELQGEQRRRSRGREGGRRRGVAPFLKSRDPHLAGKKLHVAHLHSPSS